MFARVTTMRGHAQDGVVFMRQQLVPKLQEYLGFEGAMLLGDRTVGVGFAITFRTSEKDFVASRGDEQQLFEMAAQTFHVQVEVNECDVAFSTFGVTPRGRVTAGSTALPGSVRSGAKGPGGPRGRPAHRPNASY